MELVKEGTEQIIDRPDKDAIDLELVVQNDDITSVKFSSEAKTYTTIRLTLSGYLEVV